MNMKQKITIGLKHYTGAACTFGFTDSVAVVDVPETMEGLAGHKRNVTRLKALFAGSVAEDMDSTGKAPDSATAQPSGPAGASAAPVFAADHGKSRRRG
jgi:hypothetical protein